MDPRHLETLEDLTRRYAKFRPCGAGLGVLWGGFLLALLGALLARWSLAQYAAYGTAGQTVWRFLRDAHLTPPPWLLVAATAAPFVAWLGLRAIQNWTDRQFGAVDTADPAADGFRGPRTVFPAFVLLLAALLCGVLVWDGPDGLAAWGLAGLLAIAAWAFVWGRGSRDRLTLMVMFVVSVPSLYLLASADPNANLTAGNLVVFAAYGVLMISLLAYGARRFAGFVGVRRELAAIAPEDE